MPSQAAVDIGKDSGPANQAAGNDSAPASADYTAIVNQVWAAAQPLLKKLITNVSCLFWDAEIRAALTQSVPFEAVVHRALIKKLFSDAEIASCIHPDTLASFQANDKLQLRVSHLEAEIHLKDAMLQALAKRSQV